MTINLYSDQKKALDGIMHTYQRGKVTLGGYAGTGKTTVIREILKALIANGETPLTIAPTGRATMILKSKIGNIAPAMTCHSAIYAPVVEDTTGYILGWSKNYANIRDKYSVIVADEASMYTDAQQWDLEQTGAAIIYTGDHGQLPPVMGSSKLMDNPDFTLDVVRRTDNNMITSLADAARRGASVEYLTSRAFVIHDIGKAVDATYGGGGVIASYTNAARNYINKAARGHLGMVGQVPQRGDSVICLKNTKVDTPKGVALVPNGTRGVVLSVGDVSKKARRKHQVSITAEFEEPVGKIDDIAANISQFGSPTFKGFVDAEGDHKRWSTVGNLFDFGYAATVHKLQGSQYPNIVVAIEDSIKNMPDKYRARWLYTAITRAVDSVVFLT